MLLLGGGQPQNATVVPKVVDYTVSSSGGDVAVNAVLNKPGGGSFTGLFRTIVDVNRNGVYLGNGFVTFNPGTTVAVPLVLTGIPLTAGTYNVITTYDEGYNDPRLVQTYFEGVALTYTIPDITIIP